MGTFGHQRRVVIGLAAFAGLTAGWAVAAPLALAGGWTSSGGGELLEDTINPWFVRRGQTERIIPYCIEVDEANFGVDQSELSRHVSRAIKYWTEDELPSAFLPRNQGIGIAYVGTETLVEAPCTPSIALRFQFGVLAAGQLDGFRQHGVDPTRLVAIAIRTDYDPVKMEGRGFVYLSPPRGPLAMQGADLRPDPWNDLDQTVLASVLRHELGHVFGVPHGGSSQELMTAGFPERAVSRGGGFRGTPAGVFRIDYGAEIPVPSPLSGLAPFIRAFYSVPETVKRISYRVFETRLDVLAADGARESDEIIGRVRFEERILARTDTVVRIWLPPGQAVFPEPAPAFGRHLLGPMVSHWQMRGTYQPIGGGPSRSVMVQLSPAFLQVGGTWDGRVVLDLQREADPGGN